jgi:hypothetical protein
MAESDAVSPTPVAATCEEYGVELDAANRDLRREPIRNREPIAYCAATIPATTVSEPASTPGWRRQQRLQALAKANDIRVAHAQLKKELARGTVQITGILTQPPDYTANLQLSKLLRAVPGYGRARVARILAKTCISESTWLAGLTYRQRTELINHIHR